MRLSATATAAAALALSLFTAALLAPATARAQDASNDAAPFAGPPPSSPSYAPMARTTANFGAATQWVISVESANAGSTALYLHSGWEINIHPALDYFLVTNLSVGGTVGFRYNSGGDTSFDIGARVGYVLPITGPIGFWPTAGVYTNYDHTGNHTSSTNATLGIFAPFLWHPVPHFVLGLGPTFNLGLSSGNGQEYGLDFIIGGWL
jgi:hypothetical protein